MKTTDRLFAATEEIWEGYYQHPFVQGIKDGTLDHDKFRHYIIQDYLYLIDYARVYALGTVKSRDMETMMMFAAHTHSILEYEMSIHDGYMNTFGISGEDIDGTPMDLPNASYVSYMMRVAYDEGPAEILASILSCSISYEILAKRMVAERPECVDDPFYGEWIREYASEEYARGDAELIEITDRLTADYNEEQYKRLEEIFVNCSKYEMGFWDMGWNA